MKLSVIVCARNEEKRIRECLDSIYLNNPDEVILVDGNSNDNTLSIAEEFSDIQIIRSLNSNLVLDRQKGIDLAKNELIAMIDADHRLRPGDLDSLLKDMIYFNLDIIQSSLTSHFTHGFWDKAENASWELTHNLPGQKFMIGTAPAIYKKNVFELVRFDDYITKTIDDTDFMYRISQFPSIRIGIGHTKISQYHFANFDTYMKKFIWYGQGDGEFCRKYPKRAPSMLFHLLIRYPIIYSSKAIYNGYFIAVPFFFIQGAMRFFGLIKYFSKIKN